MKLKLILAPILICLLPNYSFALRRTSQSAPKTPITEVPPRPVSKPPVIQRQAPPRPGSQPPVIQGQVPSWPAPRDKGKSKIKEDHETIIELINEVSEDLNKVISVGGYEYFDAFSGLIQRANEALGSIE